MKRYLILLAFSLSFINLYSQHLSFLGIQLGQSEAAIDRQLQQKGFQYAGVNNYALTKKYIGKFWIYPYTILNTEVENGKVTSILVGPDPDVYVKISDFDHLVNNLDKKYGSHQNIFNLFKNSFYCEKGYSWRVKGGYIAAFYSINPVTNKIIMSIRYMDNTNSRVVLGKGKKRDTSNDL